MAVTCNVILRFSFKAKTKRKPNAQINSLLGRIREAEGMSTNQVFGSNGETNEIFSAESNIIKPTSSPTSAQSKTEWPVTAESR